MIEDGSPQSENDFSDAHLSFRAAIEAHDVGMLRNLQICFPASIYSYDSSTHTAEVMPLVKQAVFFEGEWHFFRRKAFKVSVRSIQAGGFTIDCPIYVGDTGWVFSSDRDTKLLKQAGALTTAVLAQARPMNILENDYQQVPDQPTLHDFIYGFFIPDNWGSFESFRYKDCPDAPLGSSLYLGASMDSNDNRPDEGEERKFQKGDAYEKKTTGSIVIANGGGVWIASSSAKDEKQTTQVHVEKNRTKISARDNEKKTRTEVSVDASDGVFIDQMDEGKKSLFTCLAKPGEFLLRMTEGENSLTFHFSGGKLNVRTSSDVNMEMEGNLSFRGMGDVNLMNAGTINVSSEGTANLNVRGDANVVAKNARVVTEKEATVSAHTVSASAEKTVNINSGDTVNIGSVNTTNVNSGKNVNFASGSSINVTAPESINLITAGNTTIMNKAKGAEILVTTLSKDSYIGVVAKGKHTGMEVVMQGEDSSFNLVTEAKNSPISINSKGGNADVSIAADNAGVKVSAKDAVNIETNGDANMLATGTATVKGAAIVLDSSELKFLGQKIVIEEKTGHVIRG